jgi:GxxExxY protein
MKLIKSICRDVSLQLGRGFSESVYQEALLVPFYLRRVHYLKELTIPVHLMGVQVGTMRADIVLPESKTVIECKAIRSNLDLKHLPQLMKYVKALKYDRGLLVNFSQDISKESVEFITLERKLQDTFLVTTESKQFEIKF